jgi:hypothetical protein
MSVKIMGLVWDYTKSDLDRMEKYILLVDGDHVEHDGTKRIRR